MPTSGQMTLCSMVRRAVSPPAFAAQVNDPANAEDGGAGRSILIGAPAAGLSIDAHDPRMHDCYAKRMVRGGVGD
jgi:hypothetical protein